MDNGIDRHFLARPALVRRICKNIIADVPLTALKQQIPSAGEPITCSVGRTNFIWRDDPDIGRVVNDRLASPLPR